jgi:uncharacterized protein
MRKIPAEELTVVPWKNGGGVTTEIAAGPPRGDDQDWSWRVSIADVGATGPFSEFPGIDRTIAVIAGNGMDLRYDDGRILPLELNNPVDFDGGAAVTGILRDDAIRDFNVMVDRRYYSAALEIVPEPGMVSCRTSAGGVLLIHMLEGMCSVTASGQIDDAIGLGETAVFEGSADVSISIPANARVAIVTLEDTSVSNPEIV